MTIANNIGVARGESTSRGLCALSAIRRLVIVSQAVTTAGRGAAGADVRGASTRTVAVVIESVLSEMVRRRGMRR
jgi:hypothetical protein